ncbi:aldo/keto reductase [Streptococcus gallolyticus subsp. gallolyticus]|uniref:Aldehyde reductase n=1 Tax=Streptococcus gallolyticus TaxID=315405 RepID=A0AA94S9C6_9STRE|nr:aldo/keto reductase [Streptococcus gallolyticus]AQP41749.1 aldehyde reductase [Streptococcus gallolyticus subsp. gallolyticus DSM 16831]MCY7191652.1 aldo/keto reductase [Streptococcus gallolyticus subsp. gallolyticus]MCY7202668.1 aldo/keto reductase [Streptococcus gallolyticus subsp. gallolyticus]SQG79036.1 aldehyde reductase [Streptococcus gallolyticus]
MEYVTLNNGVKMPKIGLGVMQMTDPVASENAIVTALEMGYPMIDTAAAYGNEAIVGRAIKRANVNREDIFVTSKLWVSDMSYEGAKRGLEKSLENLQLDYIDLYVLHQPIGDLYGAWRYLTEAYKEGKIRAIGVDNFTQAKLVEFIKFNDVKPAVNLIQANPYHQRQDDLQAMVKRDVQMIAWQPFAGGDGNLFEDAVLKAIADKYHKTVGQVILRWLIQRDIVVIPKSSSPERQAENLAIFDFSLSQEDMEIIKKLDQGGGFALPENADQFERLLNMWEQFFG